MAFKMDIFERLESNARSYCRSFPVVFERAKMSKLYTADGREYLDFFAGASALNYGYNNDYIKERIIEYIQNDGISHALDMSTAAKGAFFEAFEARVLKPRGMNYKIMSCAPTGSDAVEAAFKLARKVKGRMGVLAFTGSYHGMTLGSLAASSGKTPRFNAHYPLTGVSFVPHPMDFKYGDCLEYIENVIADEYSGVLTPAAVIIETVQAEGGVRPVNGGFLKGLRDICSRHDILLISDDIQAGCGRTGPFFSFEGTGMDPDIIVVSKSVSGFGQPMSLMLMKPEIDVFGPGEHIGTFRGNQLAFVGAKAALELRDLAGLETKTEQDGLFVREFIGERLLPMDERLTLRGMGMLHGIDFCAFEDSTLSAKVAAECFKRGLVIERAGRGDCVLKLIPALTIERAELTAGLEIIEQAMKKYI